MPEREKDPESEESNGGPTGPVPDADDTGAEAPEPAVEPAGVSDEPVDAVPEADEPVAEDNAPVAEADEAPEPEPEPAPETAKVERPERTSQRGRRESRSSGREEVQTRIAFIGGTGPEGLGLAMRFARSGNMVFIGSRTEERAEEAVAKVKEKVPEGDVFGGLNQEGAEKADIVFITVPSDAHESTLTELADAIGDKVLVDVVVPMVWDKDGPVAVDWEDGSAAQQARRLVPEAKVISGFHHLDGGQLQRVDKPVQGDVVICGDHKGAKKQVMDLVEQIEWVRALDAGPLANSRYLENWTVVLMHLNKIYKAHTGIRVTGI